MTWNASVPPVGHFSAIVFGDTQLVPLTRHGQLEAFAIVDADQYRRIRQYRWRLSHFGYAIADADGVRLYLHRVLLGLPSLRVDRREVDHINGDRIDNRRCNLRIVTHAQNAQNQTRRRIPAASGHRNVYWHRASGLWHVRIRVDRRTFSFGYYRDKDEAAEVAATARARLMPFSTEGTLARQGSAALEAA